MALPILRRAELTRKNGWSDEFGRIYLYYSICVVVDLLHWGRPTAVTTLLKSQYAELIKMKKQACGSPNIPALVQRGKAAVCLYPAPDRVIPQEWVGG